MTTSHDEAFPCAENQGQGLSIREYLASRAMQGILASGAIREGREGKKSCRQVIVREAVALADDLIAELNRPTAEGKPSAE